jgi:four helix bundle protein
VIGTSDHRAIWTSGHLNGQPDVLEWMLMSLEQHQQLKQRTKAFALRIIRMTQALPRSREADVIGRQVLRSATSIAANYRAAGRGRSKAEFAAKLGIVIEEADETVLWLELLAEAVSFGPQGCGTCSTKQTNC